MTLAILNRINALVALSGLSKDLTDMDLMVNKLDNTDQSKWIATIEALGEDIERVKYEIKA